MEIPQIGDLLGHLLTTTTKKIIYIAAQGDGERNNYVSGS